MRTWQRLRHGMQDVLAYGSEACWRVKAAACADTYSRYLLVMYNSVRARCPCLVALQNTPQRLAEGREAGTVSEASAVAADAAHGRQGAGPVQAVPQRHRAWRLRKSDGGQKVAGAQPLCRSMYIHSQQLGFASTVLM